MTRAITFFNISTKIVCEKKMKEFENFKKFLGLSSKKSYKTTKNLKKFFKINF